MTSLLRAEVTSADPLSRLDDDDFASGSRQSARDGQSDHTGAGHHAFNAVHILQVPW